MIKFLINYYYYKYLSQYNIEYKKKHTKDSRDSLWIK
jgi:hypothetical protein